jgi:hypothetical protein
MTQAMSHGANMIGNVAPSMLPLSSQILNKHQLQQINNINSQTSHSIENINA